jgi:hypothetical protein
VPGTDEFSNFKNGECDSVVPGQGYRTVQRAVIVEGGSVVEL